MFTQQQVVKLKVGEADVIFDGTLILSSVYLMQEACWATTVAKPGYPEVTEMLEVNSSLSCNFGDLYEVRLLTANSYEVTALVTKLPLMESAESIFNTSYLLNSAEKGEVFTKEEAEVLKRQLDEMSVQIVKIITQVNKVTELTEAQNDYLKSSFNMLHEKLDTGSKESWRQAAYGVVASIGCTFMPDLQTTQSLFQIAGSYISSVPTMLLGSS
ncbi:TPA: hypothetical protein ACMDT2_004331 [Vibrio parahaemolyticus]|uniref:hypothetical protein n=1 Tax=Vibrio cholerae TaxID=666 RepID=UPI00163D310A|nr:hypothetical protein [Vibrio cholerae]MDG3438806.1 hypothetical protein [Vibrio parahaemolyticus]